MRCRTGGWLAVPRGALTCLDVLRATFTSKRVYSTREPPSQNAGVTLTFRVQGLGFRDQDLRWVY